MSTIQTTGTSADSYLAKIRSFNTISGIWGANGAAVSTVGLIMLGFTTYTTLAAVIAALGFAAGAVAVTLYVVARSLRAMQIDDTLRASAELLAGLAEMFPAAAERLVAEPEQKELTA